MSITNHQQYIKKLTKGLFYKSRDINDKDVLLVIDMQNDFIDRPYIEKNRKRRKTGKLATYNSKKIVKPIVRLMRKFKRQGNAKIIASRDYHPGGKGKKQHCSFPIFGEHCVWHTRGSDLAKEIEKTLITRKRFNENCSIVYKAFHPQIDSFGAFRYNRNYAIKRVCGCTKSKCPLHLTGSVAIKSKKFIRYPDLAKLKKQKKLTTLPKLISGSNKKTNTLYICGILGDYCVLDTAVNARKMGYKSVVIVVDLIRNLRIKKDGKVVYPMSPQNLCKIARKNKIKFILSKNIKID